MHLLFTRRYTTMDDAEIHEAYENQVGIQIYATSTPGIGGVLKRRVSDFIVREITPRRQVLSTTEVRQRSVSPPLPDQNYTRFELVKFNKDTILAIKDIARAIKRPHHHFSHAGIKDHRAITVQRVSCQGRVGRALVRLKIPRVHLKNIHHARRGIRVGELWGNQFEIKIHELREIPALEQQVAETTAQLRATGFPNYFGLQRFGSHRPNSHLIGLNMIKGNYEQAVKGFLGSVYPAESDEARELRLRLQEDWDFGWALEEFPDSLHYEKTMLEYLDGHPTDYLGALRALPMTLQSLIISSYQSYLFNKLLSGRVQAGYPLDRAVEGDTVFLLQDPDGLMTRVKYPYGGFWRDKLDVAFQERRAVVGLPIVGFKSQLHQGFVRERCLAFMAEDGLEFDDFRLPDFEYLKPFRGLYRPIVIRPHHLTIDPDALRARPPVLKLQFELPKGTYATMFLREFMK